MSKEITGDKEDGNTPMEIYREVRKGEDFCRLPPFDDEDRDEELYILPRWNLPIPQS